MMGKDCTVILVALGWFLLCAFQSAGDDSGAVKAAREEEEAPVLQYEKSVAAPASPQERLERYHVLVVSSIDEAAERLADEPLLALRMVEDAEHFAMLIRDLLTGPYRGNLSALIETLSAVRADLQRRSQTPAAQKLLRQRLNEARQILQTTCASEQLRAGLAR